MTLGDRSPLRTPPRSYRDDFALPEMAALSSSSSRFYSKKPLDPQDASALSLSPLDQLHAEQKSTIEALTYQIEFYRQREERAKKELETLRRFVQQDNNGDGDEGVSVARLAREARALGDEVDALRAKQTAWGDEKRRLQRHEHELEQQLQDARLSLTTFTQAVEQLELKMQRRDAEEQTRVLAMEQELHQKDDECARLRREREAATEETERLRRELQTNTSQRTQVEASTLSLQNELRELHERLRDAEAGSRQREATVMELQTKLVQVTSESSSVRVEMEKKVADIRELDQKLQRATELLELREKLLTSDATSRHERESQHHELRQHIKALEHDKAALQREVEQAKHEMEALKARLMSKDHGVMVATLRSEVAGVKERLRAEFKHEKDALQAEKASLSKEMTLLHTRLAEKERLIHRLQDELLEKESSEQRAAREMATLKATIHRLETDVANSQNKYQQLLGARSSLAEQLDHGFKELLEDEDTAAALRQRMEKLQEELSDTKHQLASSEARRAATSMELEAAKQEQANVSASLRRKIDELYEDLRQKDEGTVHVKQLDTKVYLLEQEKKNFEAALASMRTQLEDRIAAEQQAVDTLRETIAGLKTEKAQQHAKIIAVEDELAARDAKVDELKAAIERRDQSLAASAKEITAMQSRVRQLDDEITRAHETLTSNQEEKSKRERKLLRERRMLEEQVAQLVDRIETASTRNGELGDKIISLMKQLKGYEAEIIALKTQVKAEKQKRNELERALVTVERSAGEDAESTENLKRRLHELASLKESYQGEVQQLKRSLERAKSEKDAVHRQRDEAIKRVSMLMKCQEQMKSTVESHTVELIEEIETLQSQLDDERKRTTVFLANEKTLLRDITEKNATITRLQQTVTALQQQERELQGGMRPAGLRKNSPRDRRHASFPSSTSPTAGAPTTPKTSNCSEVSSSTQELDRILGSLERISEFSARSPSASFAP